MRNVALTVRIALRDARAALAGIAEFDRFPALTTDVRRVDRRAGESDWEVSFRRGVLRWTERDRVDLAGARIDFDQVDGDFAAFGGSWRVVPGIGGCVVRFTAGWDFGVASLAGILDPIAERVITRVVGEALTGLFGPTTVLDGGAARPDLPEAA